MSTTTQDKIMSGRRMLEDGVMIQIKDALSGMTTDNDGNAIKFKAAADFAQDPDNIVPSYYYEDKKNSKLYTLAFEPPNGFVTVRAATLNIPEEKEQPAKVGDQSQQQKEQEQQQRQQQQQKEQEVVAAKSTAKSEHNSSTTKSSKK